MTSRLGASNACFPPPNQCVQNGSKSLDLSARGVAFLKGKEGLVKNLYNDSAGHCTVGYGHLVHRGACDNRASEAEFSEGITQKQAAQLAASDMSKYVKAVRDNMHVELTQYEFDALVSFCYNLGPNIFGGSKLLQYINSGQWNLVGIEMKKYNKARNAKTNVLEYVQGLANRRAAEVQLFLYGRY